MPPHSIGTRLPLHFEKTSLPRRCTPIGAPLSTALCCGRGSRGSGATGKKSMYVCVASGPCFLLVGYHAEGKRNHLKVKGCHALLVWADGKRGVRGAWVRLQRGHGCPLQLGLACMASHRNNVWPRETWPEVSLLGIQAFAFQDVTCEYATPVGGS